LKRGEYLANFKIVKEETEKPQKKAEAKEPEEVKVAS